MKHPHLLSCMFLVSCSLSAMKLPQEDPLPVDTQLANNFNPSVIQEINTLVATHSKTYNFTLSIPAYFIALTGLPGSGRSFLSQVVAHKLNTQFARIEAEAFMIDSLTTTSNTPNIRMLIEKLITYLKYMKDKGQTVISLNNYHKLLTEDKHDLISDVLKRFAHENKIILIAECLQGKSSNLFDRIIEVPLPNKLLRRSIISQTLKKYRAYMDLQELDTLIQITEGISPCIIQKALALSVQQRYVQQDIPANTSITLSLTAVQKQLDTYSNEMVALSQKKEDEKSTAYLSMFG